jgi:F-type H+-transporting ATPase subunit epsilon
VRVISGAETTEFVVTGGFAEISATNATILAEQAVPRGEASGEMMAALVAEAEKARSEAPDDTRQLVDQRLRDVTTLKSALSL